MRIAVVSIVTTLLLAGCGGREQAPSPDEQPSAGATPPPAAQPESGTMPPAPKPLPPPRSGPAMQHGTTVHFHYVLKAEGEVHADTHGGEPATYVQGSQQMFPKLEAALEGMKPGGKKSVTLAPEDAFGPRDPAAQQRMPKAIFPNADSLQVGQVLGGASGGRRVAATILVVEADSVLVDMNHPLSGKPVTFEVEIVSTE